MEDKKKMYVNQIVLEEYEIEELLEDEFLMEEFLEEIDKLI